MNEYEYLVARVGQSAANRAVELGYVDGPQEAQAIAAPPRDMAYPAIMRDSLQTTLWPDHEITRVADQGKRKARAGAFTDNMALPIHRWFRYSAGFSAEWAERIIARDCPLDGVVFDPFAGSGTTLLAARTVGRESLGIEAHDFVRRIAEAKLSVVNVDRFEAAASTMVEVSRHIVAPDTSLAPDLIQRCFEPSTLAGLLRLRDSWIARASVTDEIDALLWLALTAILRPCSHVGTAQWQYVLPTRRKASVADPYTAFRDRIAMMAQDLGASGSSLASAQILRGDARTCVGVNTASVDLVVTSPPYPNNYDYADATRLEMTFWGEVETWGDLQSVVRRNLIRSCSQHSAAEKLNLDALLSLPILEPIRNELTDVCQDLAEVRMTKGGRKTYHTMIAAYFADMAETFQALRRVVKPGGVCHLMIGDSAPYGVYAPCDRWMGELALAAGFRAWTFEKIRDRNLKWKNRKHDVPLKEGILTVMG